MVIGKVAMTFARGFARRIGPSDGAVAAEMHALREDVEHMRADLEAMQGRMAEVDELQNRLDFTERMVLQSKERAALPAPPNA